MSAIMIPIKPLDYAPDSMEAETFDKLSKIDEEIYVCHSVKVLNYIRKRYKSEAEIDFLVIIPDCGALIIESKAGQIRYGTTLGNESDHTWYHIDNYGNKEAMKYNGPFRQADHAMYALIDYIKLNEKVMHYNYYDKISFVRCVLFPTIDRSVINSWHLPPEAGDKEMILCKDDLEDTPENLYNKLVRIIDIGKTKYEKNYLFEIDMTKSLNSLKIKLEERYNRISNSIEDNRFKYLNREQSKHFISNVIAPTMNLTPSKNFMNEFDENKLTAFIEEQKVILDYLEEAKIAVINGAAGTGKTLIAIEKAKRLSDEGKKVLFLCFNSKLKDYLAKNYNYANVRYETIYTYYFSLFPRTQLSNVDFAALEGLIVNKVLEDKYEYNCFIIDEAQDYGISEIEDSNILHRFIEIADSSVDGCCYMFYDKYQLVQSYKLPSAIENCDCKLTLFKNCRNTTCIAKTSIKVFDDKEIGKRPREGYKTGDKPLVILCEKEDTFAKVTLAVDRLFKCGLKSEDIVILTAKTLDSTCISEHIITNSKGSSIIINGKVIVVETCRKFKGLESPAVILIDLDREIMMDEDDRKLFYVGSSRAKKQLVLVFNMDNESVKQMIIEYKGNPNISGISGLANLMACKKID